MMFCSVCELSFGSADQLVFVPPSFSFVSVIFSLVCCSFLVPSYAAIP